MNKSLPLFISLLTITSIAYADPFSGPYIGIGGLYAGGTTNQSTSELRYNNGKINNASTTIDNSAGGVSLYAGYGQPFLRRGYLGSELHFAALAAPKAVTPSDNSVHPKRNSPRYMLDFSLQPGYLIIPNLLVYGRVGMGVADYNFAAYGPDCASGNYCGKYFDTNNVQVLYKFGVGTSYAFTDHINARAEYDYVFSPQYLASSRTLNSGAGNPNAFITYKNTPHYNLAEFSVNYTFG